VHQCAGDLILIISTAIVFFQRSLIKNTLCPDLEIFDGRYQGSWRVCLCRVAVEIERYSSYSTLLIYCILDLRRLEGEYFDSLKKKSLTRSLV